MRSPRPHTFLHALVLAALFWVLAHALAAAPLTIADCRTELMRWEGYRLRPYRDGDHWAVGVGHDLTANMQPVKARYTAIEVERFLLNDISWSLDSLRAGVERFDELPKRVQLVALNVAFTVGRTGFARFTSFRRALSYRAFDSAATELYLSRWYYQVSAARADTCIRVLRSQP